MTQKQRQLDLALVEAIVLSNYNGVRRLLKKGADVNACDPEHNQAAIIVAASLGDKDLVELLIDEGAEIEARDDRGRTALFFANARSEKFATLISAGADTHAVDDDGIRFS